MRTFAAGGRSSVASYSQVDAHAGAMSERFRIDAFVHNLTNSRGIINIGFFGDVNGIFRRRRNRPRSVGLALGYRY